MKRSKAIIVFIGILSTFFLFQVAQAKNIRIITRQEWGADENFTFDDGKKTPSTSDVQDDAGQSKWDVSDPEIAKTIKTDEFGRPYVWPLQYAKDIKFIVIHHTAVMDNLDNPMKDIKNIYHSHAIGKGWGDIGYHFLIDRQGNIYEGRKGGDFVIGGHATPVNKVSIGISLMGNYEDEELPAPMLAATIDLLQMLTKKYKINPLGETEYNGKTYPNIHGHRDNTPKLDPGKYFYQKFPYIRTLVAYLRYKKPATNPAKYDFSPVEAQNLVVVKPGEKKEVKVKVQNKGEVSWGADTFLENTSEPGLPRVFAKIENKKVAPGGLGTFSATIASSFVSGMVMPELSLVINGSIKTDKKFPVPIMVEAIQAKYELIAFLKPPEVMNAGRKAKTILKIKNTGNTTWRRGGANPMRIAVSMYANPIQYAAMKEATVEPGKVGTFEFTLQAPKSAGKYPMKFQPQIKSIIKFAEIAGDVSISVKGKEKPVRVSIGFNGVKTKITSETGMDVFENLIKKGAFAKGEVATIEIQKNGKYKVSAKTKRLYLNAPPRFKPHQKGILEIANLENRPSWNLKLNDNAFRGTLEIQKVDGKLTVIDELPLEDYLKGIGEVSNGDPAEKIKTIIILARSYAKYYRDSARKFPEKPYDLDDNPDHTQKYLGYGFELRAPNVAAAVDATAGKIVKFKGKPILTPYFNQSDGRTRSAEEVWGWKDAPYLQSVPDTFCGTTELKGHGVGLSGCGATELAKQGKTAEEIIKYYYKGVDISG